ncbi:hypothetical protein ACJMK2_029145, partial [Sinanodonta woodiana]
MMFSFGPPVGPLGLTAVQVFVGLTVLLVIFENAIVVRNRRKGMASNNITCGEPPSTLGDLIFYQQQEDAAFYVCPAASVYSNVPLDCPIIYCQSNGTFSTPDVATYQSQCAPVKDSQTVVKTSGVITSPNHPGNYFPLLNFTSIAWSIMTPGSNLVFRMEDFDIDATTVLNLICGV